MKEDLRERAREWTLEEKDKYIADHLAKLSHETLCFMVADLLAALDDAEREERERCARISENMEEGIPPNWRTSERQAYFTATEVIAAAIRREGGRDNGN